MTLLQHDFRRRIAKRASHGAQYAVFGVEHLSNAKVGENETRIQFRCQVQKIFWLEIYIADVKNNGGELKFPMPYLDGLRYCSEGNPQLREPVGLSGMRPFR